MVYTFSVTTVDDDIFEGEEYFTVYIVGFENDTRTNIAIQDNEGEADVCYTQHLCIMTNFFLLSH